MNLVIVLLACAPILVACAELDAQLAQSIRQSRQQAAQRPPDPCRHAWAAGIGAPTRTGQFSEALSNAQRAYAACQGGYVVPEPPPPIVVQQPQQPTRTVCNRIGDMVICNTF